MSRDQMDRDEGFTLVEVVICVALMSLLASVISAAVVVTLRTAPAVANRADAAVNVQGLVTWLPQDVDSAEPGTFDTDQASTSGCAATDPGFNLIKLSWSETMSSTTSFVASYRYVATADGGYIVRVYCVVGEAPSVLKVSGTIPPWVVGAEPVTITLTDSPADADTLVDTAKFLVNPLVGKTIVIDATTKNPNETLTTSPPPPPPPPPPPVLNLDPIASATAATITPDTAVTVSLSASDPDGGALTVSVTPVPVGWSITAGSGAALVVTAPSTAIGATEVLTYTVTDPVGAAASSSLTITVEAPATNQPPLASPASASADAGDPVVVTLPATDPEGGALTTSFSGLPSGWTATSTGLSATITPASDAVPGDFTFGYVATDPGGLTSASTVTFTVTAPPPCVIDPPVVSASSVGLKKNNPDSIAESVDVTITIVGGYCVGLALHYDTGAPNGQYVRNFGDTGTTRTVTLPKHPSPELWSAGIKTLEVKDSSASVIGSVDLKVTT